MVQKMDDDDEEDIPVPINNDLERRIADAFEVFDHAGNKTVDIREIGTILRGLGCCPTEAEVQEITVRVENTEAPGSVHLSKFLPYVSQVITEHRYEPASPESLLEAFRVLDPEEHGFLTKEYISTLMTQDGEPFNQDELDEMLEIAIDPQTQTIPYEYYINQLMFEPH
ncbi:dynein regulatory complex protein 8 isoform X2 [Anthonomus grandis grandis]|uniref:dynein regulatory complex protein 8 isoform X2 n=1 Tax=Anthonomus grandis grandis TaxID=2921223 RepID=UPI002165B358|nr:dynein regulatory complex protein 8 isoform X2 [Anthonomus grandis grandis]